MANSKSCGKYKKILPLYIDGELPSKSYDALSAHLKVCETCHNELIAYENLRDELLCLPSVMPDESFHRSWVSSIRYEAMRREEAGKNFSANKRRWPAALAGSLGAVGAMLVFAVLLSSLSLLIESPGDERLDFGVYPESQVFSFDMALQTNLAEAEAPEAAWGSPVASAAAPAGIADMARVAAPFALEGFDYESYGFEEEFSFDRQSRPGHFEEPLAEKFASLMLATANFDGLAAHVSNVLLGFGGHTESTWLFTGEDGLMIFDYSLRVPSEHFYVILDELASFGEARVISTSMGGQIADPSRLAPFSTIGLNITEERAAYAATGSGSVAERAAEAFRGSIAVTITFAQDAAVFLASVIVPTAVISLILLVGFFTYRVISNKRVTRK